jgi:hypothetical protein
MKPPPPLDTAAKFFVVAIVLLGLIGGSLIVAHAGFETSPKRGGPSVFVPAPQAYLVAALMYGMSGIGMVALIRAQRWSAAALVMAVVVYAVLAVLLISALGRD